jgi:hypothetical protein
MTRATVLWTTFRWSGAGYSKSNYKTLYVCRQYRMHKCALVQASITCVP